MYSYQYSGTGNKILVVLFSAVYQCNEAALRAGKNYTASALGVSSKRNSANDFAVPVREYHTISGCTGRFRIDYCMIPESSWCLCLATPEKKYEEEHIAGDIA